MNAIWNYVLSLCAVAVAVFLVFAKSVQTMKPMICYQLLGNVNDCEHCRRKEHLGAPKGDLYYLG